MDFANQDQAYRCCQLCSFLLRFDLHLKGLEPLSFFMRFVCVGFFFDSALLSSMGRLLGIIFFLHSVSFLDFCEILVKSVSKEYYIYCDRA